MKVKRRIRLTKVGKLVFGLLILILVLLCVPTVVRKVEYNSLVNKGYSDTTSSYVIKHKLYKKVKALEYNKALDKVIETNNYKEEYYDKYLDIIYYESDNFSESVNKFLEKGYSPSDINLISNHGTPSDVDEFSNHDYVDNISKILAKDYAKVRLIDRYIAYQYENFCAWGDANYAVGLNFDLEPFTELSTYTTYDPLMIVNKYHSVTSDYDPGELTTLSLDYSRDGDAKLVPVVAEAFIKMADAAKQDGLIIKARSAYRSYQDQQNLWDSYSKSYSKERLYALVAKPGFSEHQTGLALDIMSSNGQATFITTKEYAWMKENCYKYGFIHRYPDGKSNITGYDIESWHYRYVGVDAATRIHDEGITFEEYYMLYVEK